MQPKLQLLMRRPVLAAADFELALGAQRVGRSKRCQIVINDPTISREHAEITFSDGRLTVNDLESRNGTFVNDIRVQKCQVPYGATVRFGRVAFLVSDGTDSDIEVDSQMATRRCSPTERVEHRKTMDLTPAQTLVLDALLDGLSEKQVAARLDISPHTVHNHVREIYRTLGVTSRGELLAMFVDRPSPS